MYILGIGCFMHDFSVCLLKDGKIVVAIESERITRHKHSVPKEIYEQALMELKEAKKELTGPLVLTLFSPTHVTYRNEAIKKSIDYCLNEVKITLENVNLIVTDMPGYFLGVLSPYRKKVKVVGHHFAHACSAYYPSGFQEAAILTIDGIGDPVGIRQPFSIHTFKEFLNKDLRWETVSFGYGKKNKVEIFKQITGKMGRKRGAQCENSIGTFYETITCAMGFGFLEAGKTMGLAPYGTSKYAGKFEKYVTLLPDGEFVITNEALEELETEIEFNLSKLTSERERFNYKADVAYAAQKLTERIILHCANFLYESTGCKNICLAGGVALNGLANQKILETLPFENIFIQPATGDSGVSIGAAFYGWHMLNNGDGRMEFKNSYFGRAYSEQEIEKVLKEYNEKIRYQKVNNIAEVTAKLIAKGNIIGWFQGSSEIGPRALGNRSILVDPRKSEMKDILNAKVKHRESFRPFAPAVLLEFSSEYFELPEVPSPFMLLIARVKKEKQSIIPAVTHVDGTGRVQTVTKEDNGIFYDLIFKFHEATGVPVVLNTSFNLRGEPIVETPENALNTFLATEMHYLVLEKYLIEKVN